MNSSSSILGAGRAHALKLIERLEYRARRLMPRRRAAIFVINQSRDAVPSLAMSAETSERVGDLTMAQPAASASADSTSHSVPDDATVVKPASRTLSDSSMNSDGWQRVAEAEGGDYAAIGKQLKRRFLLERELGRGGMGVVYLARDERKVEARDREPHVAIKVLNDEFRRHPDSLIALQREARRAQRLADDNIVHVYDFDKDGTIVFMTMEYIDGTDLRTLIRERPSGLSFREAWPLIEGMARALQRAHASGIVHSDFKPGNVMVTRDGVPKVFDFGIARAGKSGAGATGEETVFDAGSLGALTPAYASLDMIQGTDPAARDDVYALGCVIFELLTGQHPFDRRSADIAMADSAVPPHVPGVSRRQYRTLLQAIAFRGDERLQTVGALVAGLRPRKRHERLTPYFVGLLAAVLLAAGAFALHDHFHKRQLETTIARFAPTDPLHYANEDQAMTALGSLGVNERERLVLNQNDQIQHFLLDRLDTYWSPPLGLMDYAGVEHIVQLRDQLKLFSPAFDTRRKQIDDERTELLATLGGSLDEAVDRDALFEDQPGSAADILRRIRLLDPRSALLASNRLELKYDAAISQSIDVGKLDEARARVALSLQLFPDSASLQRLRGQVSVAVTAATAHSSPHASTMNPSDARRSLAELSANPSADKGWLDAVANAMAALQDDSSPETVKAIEALADGIVLAAGRVTDPKQAHQTLDLVEVGLRYAPHSPKLAEQRDRMLLLLQKQRIDQQVATGDATAQIDAMRGAAAINDGARAFAALARLRALQPDHAFLASMGPNLAAAAYLGNARVLSRQGRLPEAASIASQGAAALSGDPKLNDAAQRYQLAAAILGARGKPMTDADSQALQARFDAARAADPEGVQQMETDIGASIAMPQGGLSAVLDEIKAQPGDASPAASEGAVSMASPAGQRDPADVLHANDA